MASFIPQNKRGIFAAVTYLMTCLLAVSTGKAPSAYVTVSQEGSPLALRVDKDGTYKVTIDGTTWLESHNTFFTIDGIMYSTMDGSLKVSSGPMMHFGVNPRLGPFEQVDIIWEAMDPKKTKIMTSFQVYSEESAVVFTQNFTLGGLRGTSQGDKDGLCTGFPTFQVTDQMKTELGYLAFGDVFLQQQSISNLKLYTAPITSGLYSSPLTLFNRTKHTMVLSPFKEFMVSSMVFDDVNDVIMQGIMGMISEIPKDFVHQTVVYFRKGIKEALYRWGRTLLKQYSTVRYTEKDVTLNYIGYWTDRGAFYYYYTEPNKTYEQTLIDVKAEADRLFIPYKYYQLDSWWYFKGDNGGVKNWTAMPSIFPHGLGYLNKQLDIPLAAHNRYWSSSTDYAKQNGGKWNFIVEKEKAIPHDKDFWDYLLRSSKDEWGLTLYEQDWLNVEFEELNCTLENVTVARKWLMDMGHAAMVNDMTIQYCMPMARHLLQTVEIPHMNQARASGDYIPGNGQWNIGLTSIIYHALDIRPFKDNFRTTSANEHHPKYKQEPVPFLQAVISIHSTAPVAPSDSLGFTNVTLLNRTMSSDGRLLQPSQPMMAVDGYLLNMAFPDENLGIAGLVWSSHSNVSGAIYGSILVIDTKTTIHVIPSDVDLEMIQQPSVAYLDLQSSDTIQMFDDSNPITIMPSNPLEIQLWQTAPTFTFRNQLWAVLGEVDKLVPFSPKRFQKIEVAEVDVVIQLMAGPREQINIQVWTSGALWMVTCHTDTAVPVEVRIEAMDSFQCLM
ncbi:hypothetical protein HOLleu_07382 [Holothuria leucospilota]|uniref:Uncharacterized protein n=1 Tax=Holothuria leucospilota TaxID=206669 RepID=A0A9Q1CFX3_HOLLE|nr:hypothetical protein HOLleu_07382 [Holothuria leucospilota]